MRSREGIKPVSKTGLLPALKLCFIKNKKTNLFHQKHKIMKTKFFSSLSLLFISAILCNCGRAGDSSEKEKNAQDSVELAKSLAFPMNDKSGSGSRYGRSAANEVYPDFQATTVNTLLAKQVIEASGINFRLNGSALALKATELDSAQVNVLKGIALSLGSGSATCDEILPGIRIIYARSGSSLKLYYQPLLFCVTGARVDQHNGTFKRESTLTVEGTYYEYISNAFHELTSPSEIAAMNAAIANFQMLNSGLQVRKDGAYRNFIVTNDTDPNADVKSVVCPIQQLLDICATPASGTGKVVLWNGVDPIGFQANPKLIKHTVLLSTDNVTATGGTIIIEPTAVVSDYMHLCPPSCSVNQFSFFVQ